MLKDQSKLTIDHCFWNGGKMMINDFEQEMEVKELELKAEIKKTGGKCSKILLILAISTYAIGYGIIFIVKFINYISKKYYHNNFSITFSDDVRSFLVGYLPCVLGDILAIIVAILITKIKLKEDLFTKNKASKSFILLGAVSCIGTGMISSIIYSIYYTILKTKGIIIPQPNFSFPNEKLYLILFLLYVCLVGPILEEIIFRGFILKSMRKYGNLTAIILSSILFSMFHLNLVQFINPILVGILLAFIAIESDSIFPSIIAHMFNNTITFILSAITLLKIPGVQMAFSFLYVIVGITALALFIIKYGKDFMKIIKEDTTILEIHEKIRASFSGGWSIAYIVFYIVFIIGTMLAINVMKVLNN
ncbi:hypothetical protein B0P06_002447 [Clostridium saccharoperbutylacetonicum]|nr:CPBP family intramembrane glutamic endopeptidase [Clostridium saccharoperbutylacetonicum]NSB42676.1 hypothetical protein [Clostridium saccharoperbutylacetonicum]